MAERTFIVRFRPPALEPQLFTAERAEIQGDHLVLLTYTGTLAAMFLMEIVESWSECERWTTSTGCRAKENE
jgi:hypothetical protein